MTESEKYNLCTLCKNRKMDLQTGFYCGLDGQKPHFEDTCPNYEYDEVRAEELKKVPELPKKEEGLGGFLSFYLFVAGFGGVVSLIFNLASFRFANYAGSWLLAAADILFILLYAAVCIYTVYAFVKKRPNAVALAYIQLAMLIAMNGLNLMIGNLNESALIGSTKQIIRSVILSIVFFVYMLTSKRVDNLIPRETRRMSRKDKSLIFGALGLVIFLFALGYLDVRGKNPFTDKRARIERMLAATRLALPMDTGAGYSFSDIAMEGDTIVSTFKYSSMLSPFQDDAEKERQGLMGKERILAGLYEEKDDETYATFASSGFWLVYQFLDSEDDVILRSKLSPSEFMEAYESTGTYSTKEADLDAIMALFNAGLPMDYLQNARLESVEKDLAGGGLVFNLKVPASVARRLGNGFETVYHDLMVDNFSQFTDDMVELACMNDWDLTFRFTADGYPQLASALRFTPAEYKQWTDF